VRLAEENLFFSSFLLSFLFCVQLSNSFVLRRTSYLLLLPHRIVKPTYTAAPLLLLSTSLPTKISLFLFLHACHKIKIILKFEIRSAAPLPSFFLSLYFPSTVV